MITLARNEAAGKWDELWQAMQHEWFKLEVLQDYSGEDEGESLSAWLRGDKEESRKLLASEDFAWTKETKRKADAGVSLVRIHVVDYPLSPYMEWELEAYKIRNIPLGDEIVYVLDRTSAVFAIPDGDVMIFDDTHVVTNEYDGRGKLVSETFYDGNDDTADFMNLKQAILSSDLVRLEHA